MALSLSVASLFKILGITCIEMESPVEYGPNLPARDFSQKYAHINENDGIQIVSSAWDESYHNGDTYNTVSTTTEPTCAEWDELLYLLHTKLLFELRQDYLIIEEKMQLRNLLRKYGLKLDTDP